MIPINPGPTVAPKSPFPVFPVCLSPGSLCPGRPDSAVTRTQFTVQVTLPHHSPFLGELGRPFVPLPGSQTHRPPWARARPVYSPSSPPTSVSSAHPENVVTQQPPSCIQPAQCLRQRLRLSFADGPHPRIHLPPRVDSGSTTLACSREGYLTLEATPPFTHGCLNQ